VEFIMSKIHWLALLSIPGIGGATTRRLLERFGDIEAIFTASVDDLASVPRVSRQMAERLKATSFENIEEELAALADEDIDVVTWDDDAYPANLRPVNDAPPLLFVHGVLRAEDAGAVAIVGTREPSAPSADLAERLAAGLAGRAVTVVSGLALGIDAAAHRGALQAEDGRTLAVLGSGLHNVFPRENLELAQTIVRHGAVLSELRPNAPASGMTLMARDRIVSGLSRVVIVVEARERSGSLDTAARARTQGRVLYAVPGSGGTDALLREGARRLDPQALDLDALADQARRGPDDAGASAMQPGLFS
jgi:DNA processing protein